MSMSLKSRWRDPNEDGAVWNDGGESSQHFGSQLRLGVLPLRVETDRYQRVKTDASERFCKQPKCTNNDVSVSVKTFEVEN